MLHKLFAVGFIVGAAVTPNQAKAACTCVCEEGKPRAICPSIFETPPICPAATCREDARSLAPPLKRENCQVVQIVDPQTQRIERRLVCK